MHAALDKKKKKERKKDPVRISLKSCQRINQVKPEGSGLFKALSSFSLLWILGQLLLCASVSPLGEEGAVVGADFLVSLLHVSKGRDLVTGLVHLPSKRAGTWQQA